MQFSYQNGCRPNLLSSSAVFRSHAVHKTNEQTLVTYPVISDFQQVNVISCLDLIESLHTILYAIEYRREVWMSFELNLWQNINTDTINSNIYSFRQNVQKAVAA